MEPHRRPCTIFNTKPGPAAGLLLHPRFVQCSCHRPFLRSRSHCPFSCCPRSSLHPRDCRPCYVLVPPGAARCRRHLSGPGEAQGGTGTALRDRPRRVPCSRLRNADPPKQQHTRPNTTASIPLQSCRHSYIGMRRYSCSWPSPTHCHKLLKSPACKDHTSTHVTSCAWACPHDRCERQACRARHAARQDHTVRRCFASSLP